MCEKIKEKTYLLDMDGTIYLGNELIDGALDFLNKIKEVGKNYIFLTNNASRNKGDYIAKLRRLGIDSGEDDIFTSGEATRFYLNDRNIKKIFLVGNSSLEKEFSNDGFDLVHERGRDIDAVVTSFDTETDYDKLWTACDYLMEGCEYIATHPDFVCPLEGNKFMPDAGAFIAFFKAATGREPMVIGKPEKPMLDAICAKFGARAQDFIMVGDRLYTDIAFGGKSGITSALVLSGETDIEMYEKSPVHADYIFNSVKDMIPYI